MARLRPSEPRVDRAPPPGQALRIHVPDLAGQLGVQAYQAYGLLDSEDPAPAVAPEPLPLPASGLGINLAYAVQWWGFAVAALVLLARYARREVARRRDVADPAAAPQAEPPRTRPPRTRPARTRPPRTGLAPARFGRSRRRELTDEEWEDAADRRPDGGRGESVVRGGLGVDHDQASARPRGDLGE